MMAKAVEKCDWTRTLAVVPQEAVAALLNVSPTMLRKWTREGLPGRSAAGGRIAYDLFAVLPWLRSRWAGGFEASPSGDGTVSKQQAEIDLLVERRALLKMKNALLSGRYLDRQQVEAENVKKIAAVRAGLEALNRCLTPSICEMCPDANPDAVTELIRAEVFALLQVFAGEHEPEPEPIEPGDEANGGTAKKTEPGSGQTPDSRIRSRARRRRPRSASAGRAVAPDLAEQPARKR